MILLIDNYDSFVHNLARYIRRLGLETRTVRNRSTIVEEIRRDRPDAIVISPGPCTPSEAGISLDLIRAMGRDIPILGVCLGHQAIVQALGGKIVHAAEPVHGRTSWIYHNGDPLFEGIPSPFPGCRYHSLIADRSTLPQPLMVTAWTEDGVVMGVRDSSNMLTGIQFHPESILTEHGMTLLGNFFGGLGLPLRVVDPPPVVGVPEI
jgi:anthranilate synthase component 2